MNTYFNCHNHTMYSNLRLLDCINRPNDLIKLTKELGLTGLAITDHECLSAHMEVNQLAQKMRETDPDFTIALGNEIYLTDTRENGQKYYHFILIAKDAIGHKALRELSSTAWINSYIDRRMERVPPLKSELATIINKYKGHVIATSACLGGELSSNALLMAQAKKVNDMTNAQVFYDNICKFIEYCVDLFGDDFYIECAPSDKGDQVIANKALLKIAEYYKIKIVVGTDSHYLTAKDRMVHEAYLNSKDGEREVASFYEFARVMSPEECKSLLMKSYTEDAVDKIFNNTLDLQSKISFYSLERKQIIPKVEVFDYPKCHLNLEMERKHPVVASLLQSDNPQERYWINECIDALTEKGFDNDDRYIDRIEIEADIIKYIGEKLDDCLFAYFNTFKHYIDLFWECGSIVGPGRGSATGFLSNYLLGITQLDPIRWDLPYWRLTLINY